MATRTNLQNKTIRFTILAEEFSRLISTDKWSAYQEDFDLKREAGWTVTIKVI